MRATKAGSTKIPNKVREAVGNACTDIEAFWTTRHALLGGRSPSELWFGFAINRQKRKNNRKRVLAFIKAAKSGDMA